MTDVKAIKYSYADVPTCQRFAESDAFMRCLLGPVGGGKSSGCVVEIVNRALAQKPGPDGIRRSRWAVIRNTYGELRDTTIKTIMQWLPEAYFGRYVENKHTYTVTAFEKCHFEIVFLALDRPDDIKKLLSLELTGAWVNEAREVPWSVIEMLQTRVGRYPAKVDGGPSWWGIWLDSNPPDSDSKLYAYFEEQNWLKDLRKLQESGDLPRSMRPEDFAVIFKQPSGLSPEAENLANLPGGRRYYATQMAGKSPEWIKVYVHGEYGFVMEGKLVFPEYSDAIHCKAIDPIEGLTIERTYDFGLCYSDDTEVLTDHGWKLFKDVDEKVDRAASRDPLTGRMEWAPIAFKVAMPFRGELLQWASTELNMLVTPEHRVPYTHRDHPKDIRWASAQWLSENLGRHHMVDLISDWHVGPNADRRWFGTMDDQVFAAFMGLYLSEGSSTAKGTVQIYQLKEKTRAAMFAVLEATGLNWRPSRVRSGNQWQQTGWCVHHRELAAWLRAMGDQRRRRIPREIRDLDAESLRRFIAMYTLGDGHIRVRANGAEEHTIFSVSTQLAGDLQEIAQKIGWNSSVRWRKPQTSIITEGATQRVITNSGGWEINFKKRAARAELHRRNFSRVPYDGMVYCLNVPHHTLYVRRSGRPHWNGNTPSCVFSQMLPDGRWLIFDEMVSDNMGADQFSDEVLEHCNRAFKGRATFDDVGDPAGEGRVDTDARSVFDIMHAKDIDIRAAMTQDPKLRQESVRKPLRTLVNGEPQFILHPRCKVLRKGFMGGYHRRRMAVAGPERYSEKPEKNSFSHPMDCVQYRALEHFAPALVSKPVDEDDAWFAERSEIVGGPDGRNPDTGY